MENLLMSPPLPPRSAVSRAKAETARTAVAPRSQAKHQQTLQKLALSDSISINVPSSEGASERWTDEGWVHNMGGAGILVAQGQSR